MARGIPESDWKVFRDLRTVALERFCQRVLDDVSRIASDSKQSFHDRYLGICKLIDERDNELARAFNDFRRSTAIIQLALIHSLGLLTPDEMLRFTPATREAIESLRQLVSTKTSRNPKRR